MREKYFSNTKEFPYGYHYGFLSRNLAGPERVEWYIQNAERKKTKNKQQQQQKDNTNQEFFTSESYLSETKER